LIAAWTEAALLAGFLPARSPQSLRIPEKLLGLMNEGELLKSPQVLQMRRSEMKPASVGGTRVPEKRKTGAVSAFAPLAAVHQLLAGLRRRREETRAAEFPLDLEHNL
jgi:hypothetical protein